MVCVCDIQYKDLKSYKLKFKETDVCLHLYIRRIVIFLDQNKSVVHKTFHFYGN